MGLGINNFCEGLHIFKYMLIQQKYPDHQYHIVVKELENQQVVLSGNINNIYSMILTYERFNSKFNPFRNKSLSNEDIDTISDLFLEIEDDLHYIDSYGQLNPDAALYDHLHGIDKQMDVFTTRVYKAGQRRTGDRKTNKNIEYHIFIKLAPGGLTIDSFIEKKEKFIKRIEKFIKRIEKFGFNGKLHISKNYIITLGDRIDISITK